VSRGWVQKSLLTNCIWYLRGGDWVELTQEVAIVHDAIDKTVLLILCASSGPLFDKIAFNIAEVTARGSLVMLISDPESIERVGDNAVQGHMRWPQANSTIDHHGGCTARSTRHAPSKELNADRGIAGSRPADTSLCLSRTSD